MNSKLIKVKISPYLSVFKIIDVIFKNAKVGTAQNIIIFEGDNEFRKNPCLDIPIFNIECPSTFRKIH